MTEDICRLFEGKGIEKYREKENEDAPEIKIKSYR
jgi:hypothetical protein